MAGKAKKQLSLAQTQEAIYAKAVGRMEADKLVVQAAYKKDNLTQAAELFEMLGDYRDSAELAEQCRAGALEADEEARKITYQRAVSRSKVATREDEWAKIEAALESIQEYPPAKEELEKVRQIRRGQDRAFRRKRMTFICVLAVIVVLLLAGRQTGALRYLLGRGFEASGMTKQASYEYHEAKGFADSQERIQEIKHNNLRNAKVGSDVTYGKHTWTVLEKDEELGAMLLIATELDKKSDLYGIPYNETLEDITWEDSTLRTYLNGTFLENTFNEEERSHLLLQVSATVENEEYGTSYTTDTEDYVTILSPDQVERYQKVVDDLPSNWWLRGPGQTMDTAAFITGTHRPLLYGYPVDDTYMYSRAVILLDMSWLEEAE